MAAASDAHAAASSGDSAAGKASTAGALKDDGASPCLRMDVHTHILPRTWPDLKARYGYGGFIKLDHHQSCSARMLRDDGTFFREVGKRTWDPDARIADSNRIRMNVQVLSTVPVMFSYWAKPDHALDLSKMLNDHIASCVAANPTRFVGLGTLPLQDPDLACDELKRCVNDLGLQGECATRAKSARQTPPRRKADPINARLDVRVLRRCGDWHACQRLDAVGARAVQSVQDCRGARGIHFRAPVSRNLALRTVL